MWQLIDTAPKDGTRVLLFCPVCQPKQYVGYYVDEETLSYGVSIAARQGWSLVGQTVGNASPTHWTPLPADPE